MREPSSVVLPDGRFVREFFLIPFKDKEKDKALSVKLIIEQLLYNKHCRMFHRSCVYEHVKTDVYVRYDMYR